MSKRSRTVTERREREMFSRSAHGARERGKFQFKVPLLDGASYIYARGRERKRDGFWYKRFFSEAHSRERRAQRKEREFKARERVKRARATFATTTRRGEIAWQRGLLWWCGWERHGATLQTTRPANHLNALRFRCWAGDMRWNLHVMKVVVVTQWNVANNVAHIQVYKRERKWKLLANKRGVSQSKITVSEADSTDSKFYGSVNNSTTIPQSKCISRRWELKQ